MSAVAAAVMNSVEGQPVALQGVAVEAQLRDLLSEVTLTQTYRNTESVNIEAVYTFPLPLEATLLELSVTLGERRLSGRVVEKRQAEERYEEGIVDGDTVVMLEQAEPGLYTMNLGNLQAGETAGVRLRYAQLQRWNGNRLRWMLPTSIAPRYGDPAASGLAPHQQPEYDGLLELGYSLRLEISGLLADARIESPSHPIARTREGGRTRIELARGGAALDRDFVLDLRLARSQPACAGSAPDRQGWLALASFKPEFGGTEDPAPRSLKVVVDCSGSMAGDSIHQAREALLRILDALRPRDWFNVLAFGSRHRNLFAHQVRADARTLGRARSFVRALDANMGGTEIRGALEAAWALECEAGIDPDLLLITDGEVWGGERIVAAAKRAGHRIFTVGVGASVSEAFVRGLAEAGRGACELVSPNEDMAERIHRHFQRMYLPRARTLRIDWPTAPSRVFPEKIGPVFEGDTLHSFGWFDQPPQGVVRLEVTLADGRTLVQRARLSPFPGAESDTDRQDELPGTLARLAADKRLRAQENARSATALALQYQLMSRRTNYLVVDERDAADQAKDLPELRKVPQMLAAGWGGRGRVMDAALVSPVMASAEPRFSRKAGRDLDAETYIDNDIVPALDLDMDYLDIPAFLRREPDEGCEGRKPAEGFLNDFVQSLNAAPDDWFAPRLRITSIARLRIAGLPTKAEAALRELVYSGLEEKAVVCALLSLLLDSRAGSGLKREVKRAIRKESRGQPADLAAVERLKRALAGAGVWGGF